MGVCYLVLGLWGARGCSEPGEQARTTAGRLGRWPWRQREDALPLWETKALVTRLVGSSEQKRGTTAPGGEISRQGPGSHQGVDRGLAPTIQGASWAPRTFNPTALWRCLFSEQRKK